MSDRLILTLLLIAVVPGAVIILIGLAAMFVSSRGRQSPEEETLPNDNAPSDARSVEE
jgi:hypothetical protein